MDNNQDLNSMGLEGISLEGNAPAPVAEAEQPAESTEPVAPTEETSAPEAEPTSVPTNQDDQTEVSDDILNDLSDEETIDLFIEGIMEEKGVSAPTPEIEADLKNELKEQLLREIDRSLIGELPDDKLEELNRIVTANGQIEPDVVAKMVEESNLDITDIVGTTMARFREIYLKNEESSTDNTEQQANEKSEE